MQTLKSISFLINDSLEIQDNPEMFLDNSSNVLDGKTINKLEQLPHHFRYSLMYLIGKMNIEKVKYIEECFENYDCEEYAEYYIEIRLVSNEKKLFQVNFFNNLKEGVLHIKNTAPTQIDKSINAFKESISKLKIDKENLEKINSDIESIKNKFKFRESQIVKSRSDIRVLIDNISQATLLIDNLFAIVDFNKYAFKLLSDVFSVNIEKNIVITQLLPKDKAKRFKAIFKQVLNGEKEKVSEVFEFISKSDGSEYLFRVEFFLDNRTTGNNTITVLLTDITEKYRAEQIEDISYELMSKAMNPAVTKKDIAEILINSYENLFKGTFCALFTADRSHFSNLSSPSFPDGFFNDLEHLESTSYKKLIEEIAENQSDYYTPDLLEDNSWEYLHKSIAEFGIKSCTQFPIFNSNNEPILLLNVFKKTNKKLDKRDIDQSYQLVDLISLIFEMLEQKRKNETLLNSIQDGFFSLNDSYEINYWNKSAEKIIGVEASRALYNNIWEVFPSIERNVREELTELIEKNENSSFTTYFPLIKKWIELIIYPKEDQFISVFFRDVSDRILKEQQLIDTKDRLEKVMNATKDAIYEFDLNSNIINWSIGYTELFGHSPENRETTRDEWLNFVHPDQREKLEEKFHQKINEPNNTSWSREYSYMKSDGRFAHVLDKGHIVRDSNGKAVKLIGAVTDISYRKDHEESLKHLNEILRKRAIELRQNNKELEQFAYLASHDLQEPLRTITNFIRQLERKYKDRLDEKGLQYIEFAVDGADRMRRLVTDILEYSKLGRNKASNELVDVNKVIEELLQNMNNHIEESQAEIKIVELPVIEAKESHIYQIFSNLVSNAIKYRKKDVPPIVEIYHEESKDKYTFYVKDNGIGISPEFHQKIFDIFQRLHNSQNYTGTGIGLAMVKKSVDLLDGEIHVQSIDEGTVFVIQLPKYNNLRYYEK